MPKTAVYEYDRVISGQDNVWLTSQSIGTASETESLSPEYRLNESLGLCVCAANPRHDLAPLFRGENIHYQIIIECKCLAMQGSKLLHSSHIFRTICSDSDLIG